MDATATPAGLIVTRTVRSTGLPVSALRAAEAGIEDSDPENPYVTLCETHGLLVGHPTRALALAHLSAPEGWCGACAALLRVRALGWAKATEDYAVACVLAASSVQYTDYDTTDCPECGERVRPGDDAHVLDTDSGRVLVGCEGYHVVAPSLVGVDAPNWNDWTQSGAPTKS